jgi:hypothetical protein
MDQIKLRNDMAKRSGIAPEKIALLDHLGNDLDKVLPVLSPTLAYLLCAVHKQNVVEVIEFEDRAFATFQTNNIVSDAIQLWQTITDKYKNGDNMPVNQLMGEYVGRQVSKKNMQKVNQFGKLYVKHLDGHSKTCKDCSHAQAT